MQTKIRIGIEGMLVGQEGIFVRKKSRNNFFKV